MKMQPTRHASERYVQRCGERCARTGRRLSALLDLNRSVAIPTRWAMYIVGRKSLEGSRVHRERRLQRHLTYRISGRAVWLCKGDVALTCLRVTDEALADLLVFVAMRRWP